MRDAYLVRAPIRAHPYGKGREMHAEEAVRAAFEAAVMEHGGEAAWWMPLHTPVEFGDVLDPEETVTWGMLLAWLAGCSDTMPADLCMELCLPQGSPYSEVPQGY